MKLSAVVSPGREQLNRIPVRDVLRDDVEKPLGIIGYEGGRWFVVSGFGDRLPFQWQLHMTLQRSLRIIERKLDQLEEIDRVRERLRNECESGEWSFF